MLQLNIISPTFITDRYHADTQQVYLTKNNQS